MKHFQVILATYDGSTVSEEAARHMAKTALGTIIKNEWLGPITHWRVVSARLEPRKQGGVVMASCEPVTQESDQC